jgi:hypothetical protein
MAFPSGDFLSIFGAIAAHKTINCTVFVVGVQAIRQCGIPQRLFATEWYQQGASLLRAAWNVTNSICRS